MTSLNQNNAERSGTRMKSKGYNFNGREKKMDDCPLI